MIKLVRIDYRLLHGQVVFASTRALDIDHIIVANAKAAADAFITMSLNLAKPAGVTLDIATVEQAAEKLNSGKLIIKSHGGPWQYCGNPRASGKSPGN